MYFSNKTTFCLGFALILFLSCTDNSNIAFPDKEEVQQRYSDLDESSSSAEPLSSSEPSSSSVKPSSSSVDASSSSSLPPSSSSLPQSSSSSEPSNSSSSAEAEASSSSSSSLSSSPSSSSSSSLSYSSSSKQQSSSSLAPKCNGDGEEYDSKTEDCCELKKYNKTKQFCYSSDSKIGTYCGNQTETPYNPEMYECHDGKNGIYLKGGISDVANNTYDAVLIGTQVWMAKNLNYEVGDSKCYAAPHVDQSNGNKTPLTESEIQANCDKYGRLYTWATAMSLEETYNSQKWEGSVKGICPEGWHIPSNTDWGMLLWFVKQDTDKLKAASDWDRGYNNSKPVATDDYGFSALPGGYGAPPQPSVSDEYGFADTEYYGYWWTSTQHESTAYEAYYKYMYYGNNSIYQYSSNKGYKSYSVRCVRD